jgi:hypothetical protein
MISVPAGAVAPDEEFDMPAIGFNVRRGIGGLPKRFESSLEVITIITCAQVVSKTT